jgi:geranylgeranylglycerol-phosphate geranylgeranyltransferase
VPPALRLLRPGNFALAAVAVALGGALAADAQAFGAAALPDLLLAMASAAFVGSAANALNDAYDVEIDRVNRPDRPVSSGAVSPRRARQIWAALSVAGVAAGALAAPALAAVAGASVLALWLYNARLKGTPGPGNLVVAAVVAAGPLYGALAVGATPPAVWAAVGLTFGATLARELAKDVEDVTGDEAGGARTLAVVWGEGRTAWAAAAVAAATLVALPGAAALWIGSELLAYGLAAAGCLLVAIWVLAAGAGLGRPGVRAAAGRARAWLKGAMVAGIAALLLTRL